MHIFNLTPIGTAEGQILPHLPGFINWILSCPRDYLVSLQAAGEVISSQINPDNIIGNHHLETWIESSLINVEKEKPK